MSEQRSKKYAPPAISRNKAARTRRRQMLTLVSAAALLVIGLTVSVLPRVAALSNSKPSGKTIRPQSPAPARISSSSRPWINLEDGREVGAQFSGLPEAEPALRQNQAKPLALVSGDFDGDGVPDLVTGYSSPTGDVVTIMRGNIDAIYPNSPEAKQRRSDGTFVNAAFLPSVRVFNAPIRPDFVAAGDF